MERPRAIASIEKEIEKTEAELTKKQKECEKADSSPSGFAKQKTGIPDKASHECVSKKRGNL